MYNAIDFDVLAGVCAGAGFAQRVRGQEVTFERANHHDPRLVIVVYTSTKVGATKVRPKGADAIRVCLLAVRDAGAPNERTFGVQKATRVFRTGTTTAILARLLERMRTMYGAANKMAHPASKHCTSCGAPCFADSGKCTVRCWGSYNASKSPASLTDAQLNDLETENG